VDTLALLQAEEIAAWPPEAWFVLDEYEWLIGSAACEDYIRLLIERSPIRLLITSRRRPAWATARRRAYGELAIVDEALLTMDDEETRRVVGTASRTVAKPVIHAAAGWPAILGLAIAATATDVPTVVPELLYEYLAEELFLQTSPELRRQLPKLALPPEIREDVAELILGASADGLMAEANDAGFFAGTVREPTFHPLLKTFLLSKLSPKDPEVGPLVSHLAGLYIEEEAWDSAFHVLSNVMDAQALGQLLRASRDDLFRHGRTATLAEWLAVASRLHIRSPEVDLVEAELAAREGNTSRAEQLALCAASGGDDEIRFQALCVAGRSAHLDNRESDAFAYFREAEGLARTERDSREAKWGAVICAISLPDREAASRTITEFLAYEPRSPEDILRATNARLGLGLGDANSIIDDALGVVDLAEEADPVIATSFLNALSRALTCVGRYEEALDVANQSVSLADEKRLTFVTPHALVTRAIALLGLGAHQGVEDDLAEADSVAAQMRDRHNLFDVRAVRARLDLCRGEIADALRITEQEPRRVSPGMQGEYLATRALALACAGRESEVVEFRGVLSELQFFPEAEAFTCAGQAVTAARQHDDAALLAATERIQELGYVDALIIAKRSSPTLNAALIRLEHVPELRRFLRSAATSTTRLARPLSALTPRQLEVLRLLQLGLTNDEIASKLVIERSTAKVHVRDVLRKLGVRSRTEAALLATKLAREEWRGSEPDLPMGP
jgi:ATP/maltotriose-dependent transcriptional regulator MalT